MVCAIIINFALQNKLGSFVYESNVNNIYTRKNYFFVTSNCAKVISNNFRNKLHMDYVNYK